MGEDNNAGRYSTYCLGKLRSVHLTVNKHNPTAVKEPTRDSVTPANLSISPLMNLTEYSRVPQQAARGNIFEEAGGVPISVTMTVYVRHWSRNCHVRHCVIIIWAPLRYLLYFILCSLHGSEVHAYCRDIGHARPGHICIDVKQRKEHTSASLTTSAPARGV